MRRQICCDGSRGLGCGGQHKAVTERTRTGQQNYNTPTQTKGVVQSKKDLCFSIQYPPFLRVISLGLCSSRECHFNPAAVVSSGFIFLCSGSEHHAAGSISI